MNADFERETRFYFHRVRRHTGTEAKALSRERRVKAAAKKGETVESKEINVTEDEMPDNYLYNGYFAFVLCGPNGLSEKSLSCLMEKEAGTEKKGRATVRKENSDAKQKEQSASSGHGVSVKDNIACAALEQNQARDEARNVRELLVIANQDESNLLKQLDMVERMLKRAEDCEDND